MASHLAHEIGMQDPTRCVRRYSMYNSKHSWAAQIEMLTVQFSLLFFYFQEMRTEGATFLFPCLTLWYAHVVTHDYNHYTSLTVQTPVNVRSSPASIKLWWLLVGSHMGHHCWLLPSPSLLPGPLSSPSPWPKPSSLVSSSVLPNSRILCQIHHCQVSLSYLSTS